MKPAADDRGVRRGRGRRVAATLSLLVLLLPLAAMHEALFHGAIPSDCAHQQDGPDGPDGNDGRQPSICGDGVSVQHAELCGFCATSQRWWPAHDPVGAGIRLNALPETRLLSAAARSWLPPQGSPGPRAPPLSL